jgi:hypothetical protein
MAAGLRIGLSGWLKEQVTQASPDRAGSGAIGHLIAAGEDVHVGATADTATPLPRLRLAVLP